MIVDLRGASAKHDFLTSLQHIGFAVIKNHEVNNTVEFYDKWSQFFHSDEKHDYYHQNHEGFFPVNVSETAKGYTNKDSKEFYHFYSTRFEHPSWLVNLTVSMHHTLYQVMLTLFEFLDETISVDLVKEEALLRILHYPPSDNHIRANAHTDINLLTLLPMAAGDGLELFVDNQWKTLTVEENHLVVNVGDMLELYSNGRFRSTLHRVVNKGVSRSRYSAALFVHAKDDVILQGENTAGQFLRDRLQQIGLELRS
jgi:isopenicillin N synthase-like dioxygenase